MPKRDETTIPAHPAGPPPEAHNDEQDPRGTQAQDVAEDAMAEDSRTTSPLESTKPAADDYDPAPDSTGDLIDEMRRMEGEGRIDMSAFAGEPSHDDEPGTYGGETTDGEALSDAGLQRALDDEDDDDGPDVDDAADEEE